MDVSGLGRDFLLTCLQKILNEAIYERLELDRLETLNLQWFGHVQLILNTSSHF